MTTKEKINILLKSGIITSAEEVLLINSRVPYHDELRQIELFFQGYMENGYPLKNPVFILGSEKTINAWACSYGNINAICINATTCIVLRNFFTIHRVEIRRVFDVYGVSTSFDNGIPCEVALLQVAEMFLFYHEVGHLIQSFEPSMFQGHIEETIDHHSYHILDHVSEFDADFYAAIRMPIHLFRMLNRFVENNPKESPSKHLEELAVLTIVGYMIFRLLTYDSIQPFYTDRSTHPHPLVRMPNVQIRIVEAISQNTTIDFDGRRVISRSMSIIEALSSNVHALMPVHNFVDDGRKHAADIKKYIYRLQQIAINLPSSSFRKMQRT